MQAPKFWYRRKKLPYAILLSPIAWLYNTITKQRLKQKGYRVSVPVICIGNFVMGGAGKTPTVQAIVTLLKQKGKTPGILLRGYGGKQKKACVVTEKHQSKDVGDEALLHRHHATTVVSVDRVAGAKLLIKNGVDIIVMDDGMQNPSLYKDITFAVVNGEQGLGNLAVFPAGPLRGDLNINLDLVDVVLFSGQDHHQTIPKYFSNRPLISLEMQAKKIHDPAECKHIKSIIAFTGIGQPKRFFKMLVEQGFTLIETLGFPDHYAYTDKDWKRLQHLSQVHNAPLYTTQKDAVRFSSDRQKQLGIYDLDVVWQVPKQILDALGSVL